MTPVPKHVGSVFRDPALYVGAPAAVGLIIALLIVPLRGHLVLLELTGGPDWSRHLQDSAYGNVQSSWPLETLQAALFHLGRGDTVRILPLLLSFPTGMIGVARLVPRRLSAQLAGGILYVCNPFVFDRVATGQGSFLLGYAVLPFVVKSIIEARHQVGLWSLRPALLIAFDAALSIHFLVITGAFLLVTVLISRSISAAYWAARVFALTALSSAYFLVPLLGHTSRIALGSGDLASYRTLGDPTWGLYVNTLGLYGFWRQGPVLPKHHLPGWPLLLAAILVVVAVGLKAIWRVSPTLGSLYLATAIAAYLLALGDQGPTGQIYRWLYFHFPGFGIMREPQKWLALVALVYAVGFAYGIDHLLRTLQGRWAEVGAAALGVSLPLLYVPTIFGGLNGQVHTVRYPTSWLRADQNMGVGPGRILFLPWEEYSAFPWTAGQVIANPAVDFFRREVISGDDVSLPRLYSDSTSPESKYLEALFAQGGRLYRFGHLIAQLGVQYVVLAEAPTAEGYAWLARQQDLTMVFADHGICVYRNDAALPQGARLTATIAVPSVSAYISEAQAQDLRGTAAFVGPSDSTSGSVRLPDPILDISRRRRDKYLLRNGPPGWVVIPEAADHWWHIDGSSAKALVSGATVIRVGTGGGVVSYTGAERSYIGRLISSSVLVLFAITLPFDRAHRSRQSSRLRPLKTT